MVAGVAWGLLTFMIGFGAGRLCLHADRSKTDARMRTKKKLTNEQMASVLFGVYVGLVVVVIQKFFERLDPVYGAWVSHVALVLLLLVLGISIERLFLKRLNTSPNLSRSFTDEIEKLAALHDRGLLSKEEFESQKSKLLSPEKLPVGLLHDSLPQIKNAPEGGQ